MLDIDGCLNASGFGQPLNLDALLTLQHYNRLSLSDTSVPFITVNSGRMLAYTEVFSQILDIKHHFIYENGAALAKWDSFKLTIKEDPRISTESLNKLNHFLKKIFEIRPTIKTYYQHGKEYMTTFIIDSDPTTLKMSADFLQAQIIEQNIDLKMDVGHNFINLSFKNVNKGTGFKFFLEHEPNLVSGEIAGVGDSNSDWDFLQFCTYRATPSNGTNWLKSRVDYVANHADVLGTIEIIQKIIADNRKN